MPSWMLSRLKRETQSLHHAANADRLQPIRDQDGYVRYLERIWGFEAPVEAAFARTSGLREVIDLRGRTQIKLLRSDLSSLGMRMPSSLPCCRNIPALSIAEALGWMYAVEHDALHHGQVKTQLEKRIPHVIASANSYLAGGERSAAARLSKLGIALDGVARDSTLVARIIDGAKRAFTFQRQWFGPLSQSSERRPPRAA
jgi:heme oxygenase